MKFISSNIEIMSTKVLKPVCPIIEQQVKTFIANYVQYDLRGILLHAYIIFHKRLTIITYTN